MKPKPKQKTKMATTYGPRKITALPDFAPLRKRVFKETLSATVTRKLEQAIAGEVRDEELFPLAKQVERENLNEVYRRRKAVGSGRAQLIDGVEAMRQVRLALGDRKGE
jgi:hypothetical protein